MKTKYNYDWEKLIKKQQESGLDAKNFVRNTTYPTKLFLVHRRSNNQREITLVPMKIIETEDSYFFFCNGKQFELNPDMPVEFL